MNPYLKKILSAVLADVITFALIAYTTKTEKNLSWEQVLTVRFWIIAVLNLIPFYLVAQVDDSGYLSVGRTMTIIIIVLWSIVFGIILAICHFIFHYDLIPINPGVC